MACMSVPLRLSSGLAATLDAIRAAAENKVARPERVALCARRRIVRRPDARPKLHGAPRSRVADGGGGHRERLCGTR
jgi:hypothetical protein